MVGGRARGWGRWEGCTRPLRPPRPPSSPSLPGLQPVRPGVPVHCGGRDALRVPLAPQGAEGRDGRDRVGTLRPPRPFAAPATPSLPPNPNPSRQVVPSKYTGTRFTRQAAVSGRRGVAGNPGKIAGISIGSAIFILLLAGLVCGLIYFMAKKAAARPTPASSFR